MKPKTLRGANGQFVENRNGTRDKQLCTGPAHEEPTWLPATEKYFYRSKSGPRKGKLLSRCRLCMNWNKLKDPGSNHGWIPIDKAWPTINEAVNRIGLAELARRTGLSQTGLVNIVRRRQERVQKKTLRLVMLQLISSKRKHEQPHPTAKRLQLARIQRDAPTCVGCGTILSNYTEDCPQCQGRKQKRANRGTGE